MATIVERPKPIVTAGNIVPLKVQASAGSISPGVFTMNINFTSAPAVNSVFKFDWDNQPKAHWVTIKTTPIPGLSTEFRAIGGGETLGSYLTDFAAFLNSVFELSDEFVFQKALSLNRIEVTARESGFLFNLSLLDLPSGTTFTRTAIPSSNQYPFYKLVAEVFVPDGGLLLQNRIGRDALPFQEGGQLFDLKEYVEAEFNALDIAMPVEESFRARPDLLIEFAARASEAVGMPPTYQSFTSPVTFLALPGKLPDWYTLERDISIRNFWNPPSKPTVSFLSNCTERKTAPGLSHRLFFQADLGATPEITFHIEAWLNSGVNSYSSFSIGDGEYNRKKLYEINLDWDFLIEKLEPIKIDEVIPDYFLVYISEPEDPNAYISETVKIEVLKPHYNSMAFRYRNMFGVYDDLLCYGDISESTDYKKEIGISTERTNQRIRARNKTTSSESRVKMKAFTPLSEDSIMLNVFRDFIESQEIYLQHATGMIPVEILTGSTRDRDQGSNVYGLDFEFAFTGIENTYTNA
jgi:hypothetical protein